MERVDKSAYNYARNRLTNDDYPVYNDEYELKLAYKAGASAAIQKAVDWLRAELDKEEELHYIHVHGFDKERREIFLEEFKKAMEGE